MHFNYFSSAKYTLLALTASLVVSPAMAAGNAQPDSVFSTVMVEASPNKVYEAIKMQRQVDPARKQVSYSGAEAVIDEDFSGLPVIGKAKCMYKEIESSPRSIEYHLMSSDKFKRFEGCWTLTPLEGGRKTELRLSSYLETGVHVPFARQITNNSVRKDVLRRLGRVKLLAEAQSVDINLTHAKATN
ncbi:MAG TPA: SRPBCC family protein [Candidatus Melainabacteria bacterium]|nr:SRPBCC family protein [Candidatus Melainabacteria bacterium]